MLSKSTSDHKKKVAWSRTDISTQLRIVRQFHNCFDQFGMVGHPQVSPNLTLIFNTSSAFQYKVATPDKLLSTESAFYLIC